MPVGPAWAQPRSSTHADLGATDRMTERCQKMDVAEQICYLRFVDAKPHHSDMLPYHTARNEMLVADFDAAGHIIGIELVGPPGQKPCQS